MADWNFNMDDAPRGRTETRTRKGKDGSQTEYEHFVPVKILAAGSGDVVTISRWLPDEQRWNMFSKDVPPIAWQPFPDHPHAGAS